MSAAFTYSIMLFLALFELLTVIDLILQRSVGLFALRTAGVVLAVLLLNLTTGFPDMTYRQSFGDCASPTDMTYRQSFGGCASPLMAVALMFIGVLLGIAATYIFHLKRAFSWRDFARPLVVSPIVLLPLIGSLQGASLEPIQVACFSILAFQNGFFWQQVLRDARPSAS